MNGTSGRYAYRCLPLNIANSYGWEVLCPAGFSAIWNGSSSPDGITIKRDSEESPHVVSHFGHGILTFHLSCIFRTNPGIDLMVQGPINRPKDSIVSLTGVIESDWSPYTFTMNWQFTRSETRVHFEKGEPFCHFFPLRRADLENINPKLCQLANNPELEGQLERWKSSRNRFNKDLKCPGSEAQNEKWQKHYFHGLDPYGQAVAGDHRTRLKLKPFATEAMSKE
jgi:hypothetical protein